MDLHDLHEVMAIHPLNMLLLEGVLQALPWVDHAQERGGGCDERRNILWQFQSSLQAIQASGRREPIIPQAACTACAAAATRAPRHCV